MLLQVDYYLWFLPIIFHITIFQLRRKEMHRQGFLIGTFVKHHSGGNTWKLSQYHSKPRASFQSVGKSTDSQVGKGDTWRKSKSRLPSSQSDQAHLDRAHTSATRHSIQCREAKQWLWPSPRPTPTHSPKKKWGFREGKWLSQGHTASKAASNISITSFIQYRIKIVEQKFTTASSVKAAN